MRKIIYTITSLQGWGSTNPKKIGKGSIKGPNQLLQNFDSYNIMENNNAKINKYAEIEEEKISK